MTDNVNIYWEGPGYYYFNNGWKYSSDQKSENASELRQYIASETKAKHSFCKVIPTK